MNTAFSFTAFFFPDGNTYQEKFLNAKYNGRDGNLFNKENLIKTTTECITQTALNTEKWEKVRKWCLFSMTF